MASGASPRIATKLKDRFMWSLKTNIKFAAILVAAWLIWGTNFIGNEIIPPFEPAAAEEGEGAATATAKPAETQEAKAPEEPLPVRLAKGDEKKGERVAKKCVSCHTFEKGGKNKVGPNLYNILTRGRATHEGFNYSSAMKDKGGSWSYADLDHFLTKPKDFIPGTKMGFAGIRKPDERADVILFLRQHEDSPPPLPAAQ